MDPSQTAPERSRSLRPFEVTVLGIAVMSLGVYALAQAVWIGFTIGGGLRANIVWILPLAGFRVLQLRNGWRRFLLVLSWGLVGVLAIDGMINALSPGASTALRVAEPSPWSLGVSRALLLGTSLSCAYILCRRQVVVAFGLQPGSGRKPAIALALAFSMAVPITVWASLAYSSRQTELSTLRSRIEDRYPAQLQHLRENKGRTSAGEQRTLFAMPEILGAGWQTSPSTMHAIKLHGFLRYSECSVGNMRFGNAKLSSGEEVEYVGYRGVSGVRLIIDRR